MDTEKKDNDSVRDKPLNPLLKKDVKDTIDEGKEKEKKEEDAKVARALSVKKQNKDVARDNLKFIDQLIFDHGRLNGIEGIKKNNALKGLLDFIEEI